MSDKLSLRCCKWNEYSRVNLRDEDDDDDNEIKNVTVDDNLFQCNGNFCRIENTCASLFVKKLCQGGLLCSLIFLLVTIGRNLHATPDLKHDEISSDFAFSFKEEGKYNFYREGEGVKFSNDSNRGNYDEVKRWADLKCKPNHFNITSAKQQLVSSLNTEIYNLYSKLYVVSKEHMHPLRKEVAQSYENRTTESMAREIRDHSKKIVTLHDELVVIGGEDEMSSDSSFVSVCNIGNDYLSTAEHTRDFMKNPEDQSWWNFLGGMRSFFLENDCLFSGSCDVTEHLVEGQPPQYEITPFR